MIPWLQISIQLSFLGEKKKKKGKWLLHPSEWSEILFTPFFPSKKAQESLQKRYVGTDLC